MRSLCVVVCIAAACGKPAPVHPASGDHATGAPSAELACPAAAALPAQVAKLYGVPPDALEIPPQCAPGHFPAPGLVIEVWLHGADGAVTERTAIVDAHFAEIARYDAPLEGADLEAMIGTDTVRYETADFDHDGVDERVMVQRVIYGGLGIDTLLVARREGDAWTTTFARPITYDDSFNGTEPVHTCTATWSIVGAAAGPKTIAIAPDGEPDEKCATGPETWAPGPDGQFVKR
jgi:hypothetical protein